MASDALFFDVSPRITETIRGVGAAFLEPTAPGSFAQFQEAQRAGAQRRQLEQLGIGTPAARAARLASILRGGQLPAGVEGPVRPVSEQQQLAELAQLAALETPGATQILESRLEGQISPEEERRFALEERGLDIRSSELAQPKRTNLEQQLIAAGLEPGTTEFKEAILQSITKPQVSITQGAGLGEFEKTLGKKRAESLVASEEAARTALDSLDSTREARALLEGGIISGFGADYLVNFGRAMQQAGFNVSSDEIANTEAFVATRAKEVGRIIQLFGAGTGLSDADREFATKAAAGDIRLTKRSIERILDINERASRNVIKKHNERLGRVPEQIRERLFLENIKEPTIQERVESGELPIGTQGIIPEFDPALLDFMTPEERALFQ